jgi:hypothetical protein
MGPGDKEGSILLNDMPPIFVLAKEQGGTIVMLYESLVLSWGMPLSLSVTVKVKDPDKTGVPDMMAVSDGDGDGVKMSPGGRLPVMDQEYGEVPFDPVKVTEYGVLTSPFGRLFGDIFNGGAAPVLTAVPTRMSKRKRAVTFFFENFGSILLPRNCPIIVKKTALRKRIIACKEGSAHCGYIFDISILIVDSQCYRV